MGRPLGIDFSWILVDFGSQVEPSWHGKSSQDPSKNALKNNEKSKASWRRLGGRILGLQNSWDALVPLQPAARGRGGGDAGATPRKDS